MKRIHVVGSGPRTGTTLLTEVMAACFYIDHACEHESPICTDQPSEGNCLLTKRPGDFMAVNLPLRLNPDLYVICVIRDPRDSVVSSHGNRPGLFWTGLRWWKLFAEKHEKISKNPRFVSIKYENLVSNPDEVQKKLLENIPFLKQRHKFSEYHLVAKPSEQSLNALKNLRPIEPKGIGGWKNHLPRIKQQITIHGSISEELIRFGYEPDKKWEHYLDGVEEIDYKTVRPEFLSYKDRINKKKGELRETINILLRHLGIRPEKYLSPIIKVYVDNRTNLQNVIKQSLEYLRNKRHG